MDQRGQETFSKPHSTSEMELVLRARQTSSKLPPHPSSGPYCPSPQYWLHHQDPCALIFLIIQVSGVWYLYTSSRVVTITHLVSIRHPTVDLFHSFHPLCNPRSFCNHQSLLYICDFVFCSVCSLTLVFLFV